MPHEQKPDPEYQQPPLINPEKQPWDVENQLHGTEYDDAFAESERLSQQIGDLIQHANFLGTSVSVSEGHDPGEWGRATPEGMARYTHDHEILEVDQVGPAKEAHEATIAALRDIEIKQSDIDARLWQESGIRLFEMWQKDELDPKTALGTYCGVWNTYSPDEFYAYCGVDQATVTKLYRDALARYAETSKAARQLPDNEIEKSFIRMVERPASELGIDVSAFGL